MILRGTFPLADGHHHERHRGMVAVDTGEMRPPRKGEWFLSGAIVEAYQAPNDLTMAYHIARLVGPEPIRLGNRTGEARASALLSARVAFAFDVESMNLDEPGALIRAARAHRRNVKRLERGED